MFKTLEEAKQDAESQHKENSMSMQVVGFAGAYEVDELKHDPKHLPLFFPGREVYTFVGGVWKQRGNAVAAVKDLGLPENLQDVLENVIVMQAESDTLAGITDANGVNPLGLLLQQQLDAYDAEQNK